MEGKFFENQMHLIEQKTCLRPYPHSFLTFNDQIILAISGRNASHLKLMFHPVLLMDGKIKMS